MLEALVGGQADAAVIADLAKRTLRHKIPALDRVVARKRADCFVATF
jgi:hypothetical protein